MPVPSVPSVALVRFAPSTAAEVSQPIPRIDVDIGRDDDADHDPAGEAEEARDDRVDDPTRDRGDDSGG